MTETRLAASLADVAEYLAASRPPLAAALRQHRQLLADLAELSDRAALGSSLLITREALRIGRAHGGPLHDIRRHANRLTPPRGCEGHHDLLVRWLWEQGACCDALVDAGATGNLHRIADSQARLGRGRAVGRRFNAERSRLLEFVRNGTAATLARQAQHRTASIADRTRRSA